MSEQLHAPKVESLPAHDAKEVGQENLKKLHEQAEIDAKKHGNTDLAAIEKAAKDQAPSKEAYNVSENSADAAPSATYASAELKMMARRRILKETRRHMPTAARALSKVVHQPVVEKASEIGAEVVRPSGILGGGIFALLGSAVLLYITRHYGYEYNYLMFILLFVGGFIVGMIVELFVRALFIRKKAH